MLRRLGCASLILLLAASFAPAAAKKKPPRIRPLIALTEPATDVVVDRKGNVVRAETGDANASLEGFLNGDPVELGRRGFRWTARLRDLRPGLNVFDVLLTDAAGRTRLATRKLYLPGTPQDLGLTVANVGADGQQAVRITLGTRVAKLGATLNRRRLDDRLSPRSGGQTIALGADDGLRAGRNTLVVTAVMADGGFQRTKLRLRVPAGPVAAAGPDATVRTSIPYQLDGTGSRGKASLRWDVVSAPAGSTATLASDTGSRPTFTPDVPGTYHLRARVGSSSDVMTLFAPDASIPPVGAFLQTQADLSGLGHAGAGGVLIDGEIPTVGGVPALLQTPGMIMVILDRTTLELLRVDVADESQVSTLVDDLNTQMQAHANGLVVVLSTPMGTSTTTPNSFFEPLMLALGIDDPSQPGDPNVQNGNPWSAVVAIGGDISTPQVWRSTHDSALAPAYPGNLSGYLQRDNGGVGRFTFIHGTRVPFDTSAASSSGANTVTFGTCPGPSCQSFDSAALATCASSGTGGFQVVVMRAGTLVPVTNQTFTTNGGCSDEADAAAITTMRDAIGPYIAPNGVDDYLVVIQSIGVPRGIPQGPFSMLSWQFSVPLITLLGGTGTVWSNIGLSAAPQGYALVGYNSLTLPGSPTPFAREASADAPGRTTARIAGVLGRNRRNDLVPKVTAVGGPIDTSIATMIYQAPTPWPVPSTPGEQNALTYLTTVSGPAMSPPVIVNADNDGGCYDPANPSFRASYCDTNLDSSWSTISSALRKLGNDPPANPVGFTAGDWKTVCDKLADETADVSEVAPILANLQEPFGGGASQTAVVDLYTPVHDITKTLNASAVVSSAGTWLAIVGDVFGLAWAVIPEPGNMLAGVFSEMFEAASEGQFTSDGVPALDARVKAEAQHLASELTNRYFATSQAIGYMREIIVTDYGKLLAVVNGPGMATTTLTDAEDALETATQAWAYPPLLGSVFAVDQLLLPNGDGWTKPAQDFVCVFYSGPPDDFPIEYHPYRDAPAVAQYSGFVPTGDSAPVYILAGPGNPGSGQEVYPVLPPADLLTNMFTAPAKLGDTTNLGVYRPHFFERDIGLSSGPAVTCQGTD